MLSIREFCLATSTIDREVSNVSTKLELGILSKTIYERTNYALIPHRRIYPDQYPHPIKSVDSKRQLLINLHYFN